MGYGKQYMKQALSSWTDFRQIVNLRQSQKKYYCLEIVATDAKSTTDVIHVQKGKYHINRSILDACNQKPLSIYIFNLDPKTADQLTWNFISIEILVLLV